jgi:hypothetical protein
MDGVGSAAAAEVGREGRGGGGTQQHQLLVNPADRSAPWSRSIRVTSSGERAWGSGGGPSGAAENRVDVAQGCAPAS